MNNDYLRVHSKEKEEGIVSSEFAEQKPEKSEQEEIKQKQKITLFSLLRAKNDPKLKKELQLPDTKGLISVFMITMSFMMLMYLISVVSSSISFMFLAAFVTSFGLPLWLLVFLYELNTMRNVKVGEICAGVAIGALYFSLSTLCRGPIESFISTATGVLFKVIVSIIDDLLLFVIATAFAKLTKKDCLFGVILVVVCVYSGYIITDTFTKLVAGMFIPIYTQDGTIRAIIDSNVAFKEVLGQFISVLLYEGFLMTILTCIWAVISGALISIMIAPVRNDSYSRSTIYIILFITILLHVSIVVPFAIKPLRYLIMFAVVVFSVILALKLLNHAIMRTNFEIPKIERLYDGEEEED